MPQRDITPTLDLVKGLASDDWDVRGAISELVDNSFGEARGDASVVDISWDSNARTLTVLDNGQGMNDVADLFQLGLGVGRHPKDIGKYGMGGTMALIWLGWGEPVTVWTKRSNYMASITVPWSEMKDWKVGAQHWQSASLINTPAQLLAETHGTLISLTVPRSKRFHEDSVRRELERRYAPGLRKGRRIRWTTTKRGAVRTEDLVAPAILPNPVRINFTIVYEDKDLLVQGFIGRDPQLTLETSQVEIGFGARVVKTTKDCYTAPDEGRSYSGLGVAGYIDLGDGWQDYLTTAKTEIADSRLYDALMQALFQRLEPLLQENEQALEMHVLANLALKLSLSLGGGLEIDAETAPESPEPQYSWQKTGGDSAVPPIEAHRPPVTGSEDGTGATGRRPGATKVLPRFANSKELDNLLYRVEFKPDQIEVWIDRDNPIVKEATQKRSPTQEMLLEALILPGVAAALLDNAKLLKTALRPLPTLRQKLEDAPDRSIKQARLATHLINGARRAAEA